MEAESLVGQSALEHIVVGGDKQLIIDRLNNLIIPLSEHIEIGDITIRKCVHYQLIIIIQLHEKDELFQSKKNQS